MAEMAPYFHHVNETYGAWLAEDQATGIDKVILLAHMQQISVEQALATRLRGVDLIVAGGSNTRLFDADDRIRPGDLPTENDPVELTNQNTPLKVGDLVYVCTPTQQVIALDATSGTQFVFDFDLEKFTYDPATGLVTPSVRMPRAAAGLAQTPPTDTVPSTHSSNAS